MNEIKGWNGWRIFHPPMLTETCYFQPKASLPNINIIQHNTTQPIEIDSKFWSLPFSGVHHVSLVTVKRLTDLQHVLLSFSTSLSLVLLCAADSLSQAGPRTFVQPLMVIKPFHRPTHRLFELGVRHKYHIPQVRFFCSRASIGWLAPGSMELLAASAAGAGVLNYNRKNFMFDKVRATLPKRWKCSTANVLTGVL